MIELVQDGFPKDLAARIAVQELSAAQALFDRLVACVFDDESAQVYREALAQRRG